MLGFRLRLKVVFLLIELQVQYWLVAGGVVGYYNDFFHYETLSSTEIYIPGSDQWTFAHSLPEPVGFPAHVNLNNHIYLLGEISVVQTTVIVTPNSSGNFVGGEGVRSVTKNTVYVWSGEEEEWILGKGSLSEGVGFAGGSLVPVSSGILDPEICREYEPPTPPPLILGRRGDV